MKDINIITPRNMTSNIKAFNNHEIDMRQLVSNMNKKQTDTGIFQDLKFPKERPNQIRFIRKLVTTYKYSEKSFYLTSLLVDLVMSKIKPGTIKNSKEVDLIIIGCFVLSCKFIELDPVIPDYYDFQSSKCNYYYTYKEVVNSEIFCLKTLDYNLNYQTAYDFLEIFIINGHVYQEDSTRTNSSVYRQMCFNVLKLFINDEKVVKFSQLQIAAGIVYYVRENLNCDVHWPETFEGLYFVTFKEVDDVRTAIKSLSMLKYSNPPLRRSTINLEIKERESKLSSKINLATLDAKDKLKFDCEVSNGKTQRNPNRRFTTLNQDEISKLTKLETETEEVKLQVSKNKGPSKTSKVKEQSTMGLHEVLWDNKGNSLHAGANKKESISECSTSKNSYDNQNLCDEPNSNSINIEVGSIIHMMKKNSKLKNISSTNLIDLCFKDLSVIDVHMKRLSSKSIPTVNK